MDKFDVKGGQVIRVRPDGRESSDGGLTWSESQLDMEHRLVRARLAVQHHEEIARADAAAKMAAASIGVTSAMLEKLDAWHARLQARVAEIEADDSVMGKKETKIWMDQLAAFRADLA